MNLFIEQGNVLPQSTIMEMLLELAPVELSLRIFTEGVPFKLNKDCRIGSVQRLNTVALPQVKSYASTEKELASCYHMVEKYEHLHGFQFQYITRLRPDMLFFSSVPQLHELVDLFDADASHMVVLPSGVGGAGGMNNHLVVSARKVSAAYFLVSDDMQNCNRDFQDQFHYFTYKLNRVLFKGKLQHANTQVTSVLMIYTLMRSGKDCRADCIRIGTTFGGKTKMCKGSRTCEEYVEICKRVSKAKCREHEGERT